MPNKKKKYNARFPAGRIKKIMQTDEEVGKVAQAVPIIISRTLELFVQSLLTKTMQITNAKNAKTLSPSHMKQCILSESRFDFLKDLVKGLPDVSGPDEEVPTPPLTPAPTNANSANITTCIPTTWHIEQGLQNSMGVSTDANVEHRNWKNDRGDSNSSVTSNVPKVTSAPQVPEFQISVPASFQISQPNFYTEVNPTNLNPNQIDTTVTSHPVANFAHTANIDEDYDT